MNTSTTTPKQTRPPRTQRNLVEKVRAYSGFRLEESRLALQAVSHAIMELMEEGEDVHIPKLGYFGFRFSKARHIPARGNIKAGKTIPAMDLPDRAVVKFFFCDAAKKKYRQVKPKRVRKNANWSADRKKKVLPASQIQAQDGTAAPSSPSDTAHVEESGLERNNRSQAPSHHTAGTVANPGQISDTNHTPPGVGIALGCPPPYRSA